MLLILNQTQFSPSNSPIYPKFFPHLMPTTSFNRPSKWVTASFSHPLHLSPPTVQLIGTKGDTAQLWSSQTYRILVRTSSGLKAKVEFFSHGNGGFFSPGCGWDIFWLVVEPTNPLSLSKNVRKSKWVHLFPQFSGWKFPTNIWVATTKSGDSHQPKRPIDPFLGGSMMFVIRECLGRKKTNITKTIHW